MEPISVNNVEEFEKLLSYFIKSSINEIYVDLTLMKSNEIEDVKRIIIMNNLGYECIDDDILYCLRIYKHV